MPFKNIVFLVIGAISTAFHFIYPADADTLQKTADKSDEFYRLAGRYRFGLGVPESLDNYIKWMNLAAEQGHADAQYEMSLAAC
jgi:TPR repeat protein